MEKFEELPLFRKPKEPRVPKVKEISEEEIKEAKKQKIAQSNKAWLSEFAPHGKEEDFLQRFKKEWEKIKSLKEKVGLERADPKLIKEMKSFALSIREALQDRDLSILHSNLEDFKDILKISFGVNLEECGLPRLERKKTWYER